VECGADAVELDIVVTSDGELAVTHDPVYGAFADLDPGIPRLEDVLALAAGNDLVFDIEMKECGVLTPEPTRYAEMLLERLDAPAIKDRVMVRSFEHRFLRALDALRAEIPLVALLEQDEPDWPGVCRLANAECISPRYQHVTAEAVQRAHAAGLAVIPWTANDAGEWSRLIAAGVDAIVTDDPERLVQFVRQGRYSEAR
jgi:glycerophosphoryl diester phosphodiesterase